MEKVTVKRTLSVHYGFRRNIVSSKRLEGYCVEAMTGSLGNGLRPGNTSAWTNGDSSSLSSSLKALLSLPVSAGPVSSRSDGSSVLPQDIPGFLLPVSYGAESRSVSGSITSVTAVSCEVKDRSKKQTRPWHVARSTEQAQQGLRIFCVPTRLRPTLLGHGSPFREDRQELGAPLSSCQCSTRSHGHVRQGRSDDPSSPDTDTVAPFDWTAAPRNTAAMFFPQMEDSSLKAETVERKKREMALQEVLQELKEPLEERFIRNAAVLPDLHQPSPGPTSAPEKSSISGLPPQEEPLLIHGRSVEEYQNIYHSVVDPMLSTPSGQTRRYSLDLGRRIKQRLWEALFCPTLLNNVRPDGQVWTTETFYSPALKRYAPLIEVDVSGEPMPEEPERKRARH